MYGKIGISCAPDTISGIYSIYSRVGTTYPILMYLDDKTLILDEILRVNNKIIRFEKYTKNKIRFKK